MNRVQPGCCGYDPYTLIFKCPACGDPQFYALADRSHVDEPIVCDDCDCEIELCARVKTPASGHPGAVYRSVTTESGADAPETSYGHTDAPRGTGDPRMTLANHDPNLLNAIADIVTRHNGPTLLSVRYGIAEDVLDLMAGRYGGAGPEHEHRWIDITTIDDDIVGVRSRYVCATCNDIRTENDA